jgi:hypothetical protein
MRGQTRKAIVILIAISCAFAVLAFLLPSGAEPGTGLRADETCRKLLAESDNREALSWLQESKPGNIRTLGEQSPEESLRIVQGLYESGAVKANALEIERDPGFGETSNIVCVELPAASAARNKLFAIEAKTASSGGFDPVSDDGQAYLFLYKFKLSFWQAVRLFFNR